MRVFRAPGRSGLPTGQDADRKSTVPEFRQVKKQRQARGQKLVAKRIFLDKMCIR